MDITEGASGAFYSPGALNGVVNMKTKAPLLPPSIHFSESSRAKLSESKYTLGRDAFKNKNDKAFFAYKLNLYYLKATNYSSIYGSSDGADNLGQFDVVNIYGMNFFRE